MLIFQSHKQRKYVMDSVHLDSTRLEQNYSDGYETARSQIENLDFAALMTRAASSKNFEVMAHACKEGRQAMILRRALSQLPYEVKDGPSAGLSALPMRATHKALQENYQKEFGKNLWTELGRIVAQKIDDFDRMQQMNILEKSSKEVDRKLNRLEGRLNRSDRLRHLRRLPSRSGHNLLATRRRPQLAGQRNLNGKNGRGKVKKPSEKTNRPSEPGSSRNRLSGGPATPRAARKNPRPTKRTGRGAVINAIATSLIPGNQVDDSPVIIQEMSEPRNDEPARRNPEPLNLTVQMAEKDGQASQDEDDFVQIPSPLPSDAEEQRLTKLLEKVRARKYAK